MDREKILSFDFHGDPAEIFRHIAGRPYAFLLDSNLYHGEYGRYSFMGCDPFDVVSSDSLTGLELLKRKYQKLSFDSSKSHVPLTSGVVGFIGYDVGRSAEVPESKNKTDASLPGMCFGFYDTIVVIDHFSNKLYICSDLIGDQNDTMGAGDRVARMHDLIAPALSAGGVVDEAIEGVEPPTDIHPVSNFSKDKYIQTVSRALDYIREGDIYQVNLSQKFRLSIPESFDCFEIYRWLRKFSPSSFAGYFNGGDYQILSSSPERFLHKEGARIETRPMKGTRPRGETLADDLTQKEQLLKSEKEKAELLMITDLLRNDLGRVCEFGSIRVKDIRTIEEYRTVYQATSTVEGTIADGKDHFDILKACFPGGSITGCPKIRSMEIIDELEPSSRGAYTGALGYIGFNGNMDFNVLIRTLVCSGQEVNFHVGSGIVADSDPENEYRETLVKAKGILECLSYVFRSKKIPHTNAENH